MSILPAACLLDPGLISVDEGSLETTKDGKLRDCFDSEYSIHISLNLHENAQNTQVGKNLHILMTGKCVIEIVAKV